MKFLCLGYFDPEEMAARPKAEIDAVMRECQPHMEELYRSGDVIVDAGLALETKCLRRVNGKLRIVDGPYVETKEMIGSAFLIEARDMEDAIRVASLHPTTQVSAGERFGWGIEIRPIHYLEKSEPKVENDLEKSVVQIIEAYKQAVLDQDTDAFMRLYDQNVRVFDTWGVWSYEGAGPWRKMVEGWFSSLGNERVSVTVDDVQVIGGQALSVVSAIFTYTGLSAEGQELRAMQNRMTWTLKLGGSDWRIVHEHTSAPLGFNDGKAILQRGKAS